MASISSVTGITAELWLDNGPPFGDHEYGLRVISFRYEEELGQPFSIKIELACESQSSDDLKTLIPNKVIGRALVVKIKRNSTIIRQFHAIIETFEAIDNGGKFNRYRGTAVPWCSLLKLAENSEIYSNTNARQLVDLIHKRFKFGPGLTVHHQDESSESAKWTVRTQYRETYFEFLQRSLHQEGLYYYWTHSSAGHQMNTTDGTASPLSFKGDNGDDYSTINYFPPVDGNATNEGIYEWSHNAAVQPQKAVLNDYDCLNSQPPSGSSLLVTKDSLYRNNNNLPHGAPWEDFAVFRHPGMYSTRGAASSPVAGSGKWYATRLVQAFECRQAFVSGKARCVGLAAGRKFKVSWGKYKTYQYYLVDPYSTEDKDGEYLTTKMTLEIHPSQPAQPGQPTKPFEDCTFEAIPVREAIKYRPANTAQTPRIHGVQSAIVCKTEEASPGSPANRPPVLDTRHEDGWQQKTFNKDTKEWEQTAANKTPWCEFKDGAVARVKVKFHWCRGINERTDWIRLTHLMAGDSWGEFHLPRPGDEVLVAFEHGDPDRPIIVGCLYNSTHKLFLHLGDATHGEKLKKVFAIKDPGGNLLIMDPGTETNPASPKNGKAQTISLYSYAKEAPASVQIGFNDKDTPGLPGKGSQ